MTAGRHRGKILALLAILSISSRLLAQQEAKSVVPDAPAGQTVLVAGDLPSSAELDSDVSVAA